MRRNPERRTPVFSQALKVSTAGLAAVALAVAGCGGSSDNSSSSSSTSGGGGSKSGVNVAAAKAVVAQYSGKPTEFPVDQPLKAKPTGKTFAYFQCSTPVCALFTEILQPTQKQLGYKLKVVKAGPSANQAQAAMNSIISLKPAGVVLPATDPNQFLQQIKQLNQAKVPISANGILDPEKYGIQSDFINNYTDALGGKLMADWAVANAGRGEVAFYGVPELSVSAPIGNAFDAEMAKVCSSCTVRHVDIPIASIGTDAPNRVVSDLQSHPNTKAIAFVTSEAGTGLPAALKSAGLKVKIVGGGPTPATLGYIKNGQWDAAIGVDFATMIWAQVDALARLTSGQPLTSGEKRGLPPIQILTKSDITFDPTKGWVAYPDFAQRFAKLWGAD
jgi:ribose transport system substrate-binding protein